MSDTDNKRPRRCLGCGNMFESSSPGNRFCKTCKKSRKRLSGGILSFDVDNNKTYDSF